MVDKYDRPKSKIFSHQCFNGWIILGESYVHLHGSLRMTNVVDFLFDHIVDISECSRNIVVSHVLERKGPECCILIRIQLYMLTGVLVSSTVSQPHIITSIGKNKGWSLIFIVDDPSIGTIEQAVLKEHRHQSWHDSRIFLLNSEIGQQVSIFSLHNVLLNRVVKVLAVAHEGKLSFGVLFGRDCHNHKQCYQQLHYYRLRLFLCGINRNPFMKRPKSAQLLSNYIQVYNPDEFRYHRLQIHNKMNVERDGEEMRNPILAEIINRGPSYLNTGNMLEPNISNLQKGKMKLEACKKLNIRQFIGVSRKIRQVKQQSQMIEEKLGSTQQIKVPNAKLMIAQINSSFNRSLRRSVKSRMIRSTKSYSHSLLH